MSRTHPVVGGEGEGEVPGPADPLSFSTEVEVLPPVVSVFVPPRNSLSGNGNSKSSLICQATDFSPKQISLSWFRDGRRMVTGISEGQVETVQSSPVTFRAYSVLTITESDWLSQSVYTCQVEHNKETFQKNASSSCDASECNPGGWGHSRSGLQTLPQMCQLLPEPWLPRAAKGRRGCARQLGASTPPAGLQTHRGLSQVAPALWADLFLHLISLQPTLSHLQHKHLPSGSSPSPHPSLTSSSQSQPSFPAWSQTWPPTMV